jgi:hypothetical protein
MVTVLVVYLVHAELYIACARKAFSGSGTLSMRSGNPHEKLAKQKLCQYQPAPGEIAISNVTDHVSQEFRF